MAANKKTQPRTATGPGFFRQGVLILLPVILLAVVGTSALRKDRRMAEAEARERAQQFADDLARRVLLALEPDRDPAVIKTGPGASGPDSWFKLAADGEIAFPGPYEAVPEPAPENLTSLNSAQRQLWYEALRADRQAAEREAGLREFLRANPASNFLSRADALLGAALLEQSRTNEALECFGRALTCGGDVRGESGVPLNDLLLLRLLRLYPASTTVFTNVASLMVVPGDPPTDGLTHRTALALVSASAVAPMLVAAADGAGLPLPPGTGTTTWRQYWQALQEARSFARGWENAVGSEGRHSPPRFVWVTNETHWLAARVGAPASEGNRPGQIIIGFFGTNAVARIAAAVADVKDLPEHLGVSATLAGQPVSPRTGSCSPPRSRWARAAAADCVRSICRCRRRFWPARCAARTALNFCASICT